MNTENIFPQRGERKWLQDRHFRKPYLHNILRRERLHNFLTQQVRKRLIFIQAKAGQGKSILLSDFLSATQQSFLWINIEENDRNPDTLLTVIIEGLENYLQQEGTPVQNTDLMNRCISLFENIKINFTLILDDFHILRGSPESEDIINKLLQYLPPSVTVFILSRTLPGISLSRLRSKQELLEINEKDLRFTLDEISLLMEKVFQLKLEKNTIIDVDKILQGWITGYIFLIEKLSCMIRTEEQQEYIQTFLNKGNREQFFEFFSSEIMSNYSDCERDMLIALSPFNAVTPNLGTSIGGKEGARCLGKLIRDLNFIEQDGEARNTYRFHPLFADYLKTRFNDLPEEKKTVLLKKTVPFFEETDDIQNLIPVLIKLGEIEKAKTIFVSYAEKVLDLTQHKKIRNILKSFPMKTRQEDPLLNYYSALALNLERPFTTRQQLFQLLKHFKDTGDIDRQARIYTTLLANFFFYQESKENVEEIVVKAASFLDAKGNEVDPERKEILLSLLPLGKNWIGTNIEKSFENAMRAEETSFKLNNKEAFLCSRLVLARNYLQSGEFTATKRLLTQTWNMLEDKHLFHPYAALLKFYMGDADFYTGDIHQAIQHVQEGLNISSPDFAFRPYLELNLILYNLYLNNIDQAEKLFEATREADIGENLYLNYYRVYLLQMLIAYRNKNWRRAEYYCNRLLEEGNESLLMTDYPYSFTALIEVNIALENYDTARSLLTTVREDVNKENYPYSAVSLQAMEVLCDLREGKNIEKSAAKFSTMQEKYQYKNLDICDPELLEEICAITGITAKEEFPRLKSINITSELKKNSYDLDIYTFGNFRIFIRGKEIPSGKLLSQKRVMDLLKLLIIYRKNGIHKDTIYETFWPKYSYKSARDNLNTIIYRLRNIFGKGNVFLSTDVSTIGFVPNIVRTDIDSFNKFSSLGDAALKSGETGSAIEMYKEAVSLYKGDFLEGDLYSDFIRDERESLKRMYLGILFKLTKLFLDTGDYLQALETLKHFNHREPLYEPATRLFMITSTLIGNRSIIPRIFDELGSQLRENYNIDPDDKTLALKELLISGDKITRNLWIEETFI